MSNGGIFVIASDQTLAELVETPFGAEADFQQLLEAYPQLLPGAQIDSEVPRRWLLISREAAIPGEEDGAGRWALDHLFVDQDGIPTLVEVKRSTDTRIRREVVGQMLDYAANALAYWSIDKIISLFEANCDSRGCAAADVLADFLAAGDAAGDDFWQRVKTNLQAGRIRLLFVADRIPAELARIIEFLNKQMDPAEVLGVELRHYAGATLRTLVPQVIGKTAEAVNRKQSTGSSRRSWDETSFFAAVDAAIADVALCQAVRALYDYTAQLPGEMSWGTGTTAGSFSLVCPSIGTASIYSVYSNGRLIINFGGLRDTEVKRQVREALATALSEIGFAVPADYHHKYPCFSLDQWLPVRPQFQRVIQQVLKPYL